MSPFVLESGQLRGLSLLWLFLDCQTIFANFMYSGLLGSLSILPCLKTSFLTIWIYIERNACMVGQELRHCRPHKLSNLSKGGVTSIWTLFIGLNIFGPRSLCIRKALVILEKKFHYLWLFGNIAIMSFLRIMNLIK